jgi:hypothetical protein
MISQPMSHENQMLSLAHSQFLIVQREVVAVLDALAHGITAGIDVPTLALRFESALDSLSVIQEEAALARLDAAKQAVVSALAAD